MSNSLAPHLCSAQPLPQGAEEKLEQGPERAARAFFSHLKQKMDQVLEGFLSNVFVDVPVKIQEYSYRVLAACLLTCFPEIRN